MASHQHQQCRTPLQTRVHASLVGRTIGRPKDWGYKACISISTSTSTSISISINTRTSTSISTSISISTSTNIRPRNPCRTKFQEHSHLCLLRRVHTTGQNAIGNVMWPLHHHRAVAHNIRRSGALSVSGHLFLHRLLHDNERGSGNGNERGNGRRVISHPRPTLGNMP